MIRIQIAIRLSSLLVRDVYARLIKSDGDDQHYLCVGRWLAPVIIFGSFAYVSFMGGGMLLYYLGLVGAFVVPLLTMYLMAKFTRVHQNSCAIGLVVVVVYGLTPLLAPHVFPEILGDDCAAYFFGVVVTAETMVIVSVVMGWEARGQTSSPGADQLAEVE